MSDLQLPKNVHLGDDVIPLLNTLGAHNDSDSIEIDFQEMNFYSIAAVVALMGKLMGWANNGTTVSVGDYTSARCFPYLQRMDFFNLAGISTDETFSRRNSVTNFVELKHIGRGASIDTASISTNIADCIAPELANEVDPKKTGYYDCIEYAVSELMNNVIQHSGGSGFIGAQYYRKRNTTQIAIADTGIGIMQSFFDSGSPHRKNIANHRDAMRQALLPKTSSKTHIIEPYGSGPVNAGVGLTLLSAVAMISGGEFLLISGDVLATNRTVRF